MGSTNLRKIGFDKKCEKCKKTFKALKNTARFCENCRSDRKKEKDRIRQLKIYVPKTKIVKQKPNLPDVYDKYGAYDPEKGNKILNELADKKHQEELFYEDAAYYMSRD